MAKTTLIEAGVEITADYSQAEAAADKALTTTGAKLNEISATADTALAKVETKLNETADGFRALGQESGNALAAIGEQEEEAVEKSEKLKDLMVGHWGAGFHGIEHAAAHAFGEMGMELVRGGVLAVAITAGVEGAMELGKEFFKAGEEAEKAAEKARESFLQLDESLQKNVESIEELVNKMHELDAKTIKPSHAESSVEFINQAVERTKPKQESHFEAAENELKHKAEGIDKRSKEIDSEFDERKKRIAELTKKRDETIPDQDAKLKEYEDKNPQPKEASNTDNDTERAEAEGNLRMWNAARSHIMEQEIASRKKIQAEIDAEQQQQAALVEESRRQLQKHYDLGRIADKQLQDAAAADTAEKAAKEQAKKDAELAKKKVEQEAQEKKKAAAAAAAAARKDAEKQQKGQEQLDRESDKKKELAERMADLTKKKEGHVAFHGLENIGQDIQAGLQKNDMATKLEEIRKLHEKQLINQEHLTTLLGGHLLKEAPPPGAQFQLAGH